MNRVKQFVTCAWVVGFFVFSTAAYARSVDILIRPFVANLSESRDLEHISYAPSCVLTSLCFGGAPLCEAKFYSHPREVFGRVRAERGKIVASFLESASIEGESQYFPSGFCEVELKFWVRGAAAPRIVRKHFSRTIGDLTQELAEALSGL